MAQVHTAYGPGEIVETQTTRGRTEYRVAGRDFNIWLDETKLQRVADAFQSPDMGAPTPHQSGPHGLDYNAPELSEYAHPSMQHDDTDWHPSDSYGDLSQPYPQDTNFDQGGPHRHEDMWSPEEMAALKSRHDAPEGWDPNDPYTSRSDEPLPGAPKFAWAPVDHDNSVNLPYDPTPQYPAIPGDTESTLQPIHEIDADERLSPSDSITFEDRSDDESIIDGHSDNFARAAGAHSMPPGGRHRPGPDYDPRVPPGGFQVYEGSDYLDRPEDGEGQPPVSHRAALDREGFLPLLIPLAEGLMAGGAEAGAAAGAAGEVGAAGAGAAEGGGGLMNGISKGIGGMGGGGDDEQQQGEGEGGQGGAGVGEAVDKAVDFSQMGPGWGYSQRGASIDNWLDSQDQGTGRYAGLSDKYIDITADADYHNDPVAQFRHDPLAYISRIGHVLDEPVSPEMEHYGNLVEGNVNIREAAWKDVRQKAMRLRREGAVQVKDISPDRIYASVQGDNGLYDTMIVKGGAFGGFGGGHSITNWRCSCEWGRWAFKRQFTYVGRLCSHGYAAYMEMNSNHMKGAPRQRKLHRYKKKADALQNEPQRLVPELVINDSDDAAQFFDVTKDERKDTGPDDIVDDKDIVHFAKVLSYCEANAVPYPRQLVAFLERYADDQTPEDWKVTDTGKAESALNEIRDWSDKPVDESWGNMEDRNDDIRDAVDEAREKGVDASQLVAFRTAAPDPRDKDPNTRGIQTSPPGGGGWSPGPLISGNPDTDSGPMFGPGTDQGATHRSPASPTAPKPGPAGAAPGQSTMGNEGGRGGLGTTPAPNPGGIQIGPQNAPGAPPVPPAGPGGAPGGGKALPGGVGQPSSNGGALGNGGTPVPGGNSGPVPPGGAGGMGGTGAAPLSGEYKINQGDTLSDIAQRSGYGENYQGLSDQLGLNDANKINAGDTINLGTGKGDAGKGVNDVGGGASSTGKGAIDTSAVLPTGGTGGPGAGGPGGAVGDSTPHMNLDGGGGASGGLQIGDAGAAATPPLAVAPVPVTPPTPVNNKTVASLFSDQADYDNWQRLAYPDGPMKSYNHQPFNGSGGDTSIEFGTSEPYADKARKDADDVTDLEHHNVNEKGGIKRAGKGARRHVEPTVVREQRPTKGGHRQTVEASMESFASFDPLAARSPEDFSDDEAAVHIATNSDDDIVAQFHRSAGAQEVMSSNSDGGGGREEFDIAGAAGQFLQRTAGRNFSLAEQHELIREGDIGGAGNLDSLDLRDTHYSENSVGLFT